MSSRLARVRAALVAIGVVLAVAVVFTVFIVALGGGVGFVWGTIFGGGGAGQAGPTIEFATTLEGDQLTIRHAGGNTVDPADVVLQVDGERRGTWADHGDSSTVAEGSSITLDGVASGDRLRITWGGGDEPFVLEETTV
ncbi:type IV pilin [Halovivax limisalsi]|uniref:type IV pilin n=1 Tax=Halovivax limisalsi TaxID=1453760 RepID=UPI001FFDE7DF|nr:type IV pilin [Halovivax limisalsi]